MRKMNNRQSVKWLPCIAVFAIAVYGCAFEASAEFSLETVTLNMEPSPAPGPVVLIVGPAVEVGEPPIEVGNMLIGTEFHGLITLPRGASAQRVIVLQSSDGASFLLGLLKPDEIVASICSGPFLHVATVPVHSFTYGSIAASFETPQP